MQKDALIIRDLAKEVMEIANKPIQEERRNLWRKHNSFKGDRPLIYVRAFAFDEIFPKSKLKCEDPFLRGYEYYFNMMKFRDTINDDFIIEPWLTVNAVFEPSAESRWGVKVSLGEKPHDTGAAAFKPEINEEEDFNKLIVPQHKINESATKERFERLYNVLGDLMNIHVKRDTIFNMWSGDISADIAKMRGLEQIMWDMYDRPEWLHRLLAFMRDGILKVHEEAEKAGDFSLADHQNQSMPYTEEMKDPNPHAKSVKRNEMWWYMASQEYTTFGPDSFNEFLLQYQIPILEKFGMVAYGCCEDLTQKIDYLRKIPNLRRIAVTPFANVQKCSEQIGKDYILSWRPNPSTMIAMGIDEAYIRKHIRENLAIFQENGNHFDITLKDVETISNNPENVSRWVKIVREEIG